MSLFGTPHLGARAAAVLVDEFARQAGPKSAVLVGVAPDSPVLTHAVNALLPGDSLTLVAESPQLDRLDETALTARVAAEGSWVAQRVTVVSVLADAKPADAVLVGQPVAADAALPLAEALHDMVAPGGALCLASVALPGQGVPDLPVRAAESAEGLEEFGEVATDLVLLNRPPVRVHRLRRTPTDLVAAERMEPAFRPSSVPLTGQWRIDSNGVAAGAICLGAAALTRWARPDSRAWLVPALASPLVAAFFRDPERIGPEDPDAIVSGADGKVLAVERLTDTRFGPTEEWLRISVFLSVLDVHINRSPVAGKVIDIIREEGGYAPAMNPSAEHNVAAYTVLETSHGPAVVAQRTGLVARRIVNRARPGTLLARGERYGLIRFGSRTDVYLPVDAAQPQVAPGESVVGGESVIARWR